MQSYVNVTLIFSLGNVHYNFRILMNFGLMYQKLGERDGEREEKLINRRYLLYSSRNKINQGPLHTAG